MSDDLEILKALTRYKIAYHPLYAKVCGGVKAGLVLAQLLYWWDKKDCNEFWKSQLAMESELQMKQKEIRYSINRLKALNIITIVKKGFPKRSYFTIHVGKIVEMIVATQIPTSTIQPIRANHTAHKGDSIQPIRASHTTHKGELLYIDKTTSKTTPETTTDIIDRVSTEEQKVNEVIEYFNLTCHKKLKGSTTLMADIKNVLSQFTFDEVKAVIDYTRNDPWHIEHGQVRLSAIMRPTKFHDKLERTTDEPRGYNINPIRQLPGANSNTAVYEDTFEVLRQQKALGQLRVEIPKTPYERLSKEDREEIDKMREEESKNE